MPTVRVWTGREARALRGALRLSVRAFAEHLGVAVRTVSKWESLGAATQPRPDTQAILDTALERADQPTQMRFRLLLGEAARRARDSAEARPAALPVWDYETWADDLERAVVLLSRQNFRAATGLINRWVTRFPAAGLDAKGLYLYARSLVLLGDARRDQGMLIGPMSAGQTYRRALAMFTELDIPRRVAQIELSLAVVAEMAGDLQGSAHRYRRLADDERLSGRDRARSLLWVGTALSKDGDHDYAVGVMTAATRDFEDLGEAEDWSVAQQKLALAHRGAGRHEQALHFVELARLSGTDDTALQKVRLATAHAHIMLADPATCQDGLAMLEQTATLAQAANLSHQLRAIASIRHGFDTARHATI
jgi:transcriptional regulator with XRE-family HTH domain